MGQRLDLQTLFETLLGSKNVYFQPMESVKMNYPCIRYAISNRRTFYADNNPYHSYIRYQVTYIDPDPDSPIPDKIMELPMVTFDRRYTANNLYHDVFELYF